MAENGIARQLSVKLFLINYINLSNGIGTGAGLQTSRDTYEQT
jgi:hypothetical protein